jgi:hypothetical protein
MEPLSVLRPICSVRVADWKSTAVPLFLLIPATIADKITYRDTLKSVLPISSIVTARILLSEVI